MIDENIGKIFTSLVYIWYWIDILDIQRLEKDNINCSDTSELLTYPLLYNCLLHQFSDLNIFCSFH